MSYSCRILADSVSEEGKRLTTMEVTYPRFVHSEFMTHRMFSRNAASSRAIPIQTMINAVKSDPVFPVWWGKNQSGMQAREELTGNDLTTAQFEWFDAREAAVSTVERMSRLGLHKQIANRLLEPWLWITVIVSATEWENFFALRCHPDAQPELRHIAEMMRDVYRNPPNPPDHICDGGWHLPLVTNTTEGDIEADNLIERGYSIDDIRKISVGRCARVSYLTHDGKRDPQADIDLCNRLITAGHWSPFEHVATPSHGQSSGNFYGWRQFRKLFPNENITKG